MIQINEINGTTRFHDLGHEWSSVLEKSTDRNIFLTWEFLYTYWRHFGSGKKLRILVIEDKTDVIAIAPFVQTRYNFGKAFSYNVIEPLGARAGADYNGLILTKKKRECLSLFLKYLVENDDWDFIYLYDLPGTTTIPELLPANSTSAPVFEVKQSSRCPFISLPNSNRVFLNSLDSSFRKNLNRCIKNLKNDYQKVEIKKYSAMSSVHKSMEAFFELHQERWSSKLEQGIFNTQENRNFAINLAYELDKKGWLGLTFLTVQDEPIATQFCFEYNRKTYNAQGGFKTEYSKYSVGSLLTWKVIEDCIARGIREYDFMKGCQPYKLRWTKQYRTNIEMRFVNSRFKSNLYDKGIKLIKQARLDKILGKHLSF